MLKSFCFFARDIFDFIMAKKLLIFSLALICINATPTPPAARNTIFIDEQLEGQIFEAVKFTSEIDNYNGTYSPSDFRLPTTTKPNSYDVLWVIDMTRLVFTGEVTIYLVATQANVSEIVIHAASDLSIGTVRLQQGATVIPQTISRDDVTEFLVITPSTVLQYNAADPVVYSLYIEFNAELRRNMQVPAVDSNNTLVYEVITRPGALDQSDYAFEVGQKLLAAMDNHTGIPFLSMSQNLKMTQAEAYLMYDEEHTHDNLKQIIAYILSHEIAHMWFGNLVEDYMGFDTRFVVEQVHTSMLADSANNPHPLYHPAMENDPDAVWDMFSTISYNKGACIIRMTEHLLGFEARFNINTGISTDNLNWQIPITFASASNPDFTNTKPTHILRGTTMIVDDVFQFARSGLMNYTRAFNILSFLEGEQDYAPWVAALSGFSWLRNRLAGTTTLTTLEAQIARWATPLMNSLTYRPIANESWMRSYLRRQLAPVMCNMNVPECIAAANTQFQALVVSGTEVPVNNRNWVYCNGLRAGLYTDFQFMLRRYNEHNVYSEKIQLLQTLENYVVRPQDYSTTFNNALTGNEANTQIVFNFIQQNLEAVSEAFDSPATPLANVASRLRTPAQVTEGDLNNYFVNGDDQISGSTVAPTQATTLSTSARPGLEEPVTPQLPDSAVTTAVSAFALTIAVLINRLVALSPVPVPENEWEEFFAMLNDPQYRLPTTSRPTHYEVTLTPYLASSTRQFTFDGQVTIQINVVEATNQLVLHCNDLVIQSLSLERNGVSVPLSNSEFSCEMPYSFLRVTATEVLPVGSGYVLRSTFTGNLQSNMRGFYRSWYKDSSGERRLSDNSVSETFFTTPLMSTYLIAFIVSHYKVVATNNNSTRPFHIYARDNAGITGDWALEVGVQLLEVMENYTQIPYYEMAAQIDMKQTAIPDFSAGAMENWALLTYREALILYDPLNSNHFYKQRIANIVSHEVAHMWFGNLVTCAWWDNLWLNEGFARFYQYFLTQKVVPELGYDTRFIVEQLHVSLLSDSVDSAHALTDLSVNDPTSVSAHFSTITYARGASVLRMTQYLLGQETYDKALVKYLSARKWDVAEPHHLFEALDAAAVEDGALSSYGGITIDTYFRSWSEKAGHPLLDARWERDTGVSQFDYTWDVPITWTRAGSPDFNNLKPSQFIRARTETFSSGKEPLEWLILNKQQSGFYRVNYDRDNWVLLTRALRSSNRTVFHEYNRAHIVDDLFNFARAGIMPYNSTFNILSFLENEDQYAPWIAAITGFNFVRRRLAHDSENLEKLQNRIIASSRAVASRLGYSEKEGEPFMDGLLLKCLSFSIPANMRPWVYCAGLRQGTAADFNYFWNRYLNEDLAGEIVVMLQAAGCTKDTASLEVFLNAIVDGQDTVRPQDHSTALSSAVTGNEENTLKFRSWLDQNRDVLGTAYSTGVNAITTSRNNLEWSGRRLSEFVTFFDTGYVDEKLTFEDLGEEDGGATIAALSRGMLVTALAVLLVGLAHAEPEDELQNFEWIGYTTNVDDPKYRLKDNVQPLNIIVDLDVYLTESRFTGVVNIEVENVVSIGEVTVVNAAGQPVVLQFPNPITTDSYYEILNINFASTVIPGIYFVTINYEGRINENPHDRGFYKGYYYYGTQLREYATTQFQPFHARKAFPCFDEPQFKCPFVISITRDSNLSPTFSNMAINSTEIIGNRVRETFLPTPIISSYLVAFHVSDFVATSTTGTAAKPFQVISRQGDILSQHSYAATVGFNITEEMSAYFDYEYYNMGNYSMKNDHIALPDFPSGAMENWGMVNYSAYGIAYPEDMYEAFRVTVNQDSTFAAAYPNIDIGAVFESWVQNPGSPVVDVAVNMTTGLITVTQERFQLTGTPPNTIWQIPISWTHGGSPDFSNTRPQFVLTSKTTTIQKDPGHAWVVFNIASSGLYRVSYDDHNWEMIAAQVRNDRNVIHKLSRAGHTHRITIPRAFDVLSFLAKETDYYVWNGALTQLDWIRSRLRHLPAAYQEFNEYLLELMDTAVNEVGYEEGADDSASTIQQRMQILNYACTLGHQGCIADSLQKWNEFRNENKPRYVYCTGLREGNITDFNFLFQKYNTSENTADMVVMLRTLACTKDQSAIKEYLFQSMYNDRIRIHDRNNAFSFALLGNEENLDTVLTFLYGGDVRLTNAISAVAAHLTNFSDIVKFQAWAYENQIALGTSFSTAVGVVNTGVANLRWGNNVAAEIFSTLRSRSSATSLTTSIFKMSPKVIFFALFLIALSKADNPLTLADIEDSFTLNDAFVFREDQQIYRLPTNVIPLEYDISIDLFFDEISENPYSYNGIENIIIQAVENNVNQITLHANVDRINYITVTTEDGVLVDLQPNAEHVLEPQYHFLRINLLESLIVDRNYTLMIDYSSTMNEGPMKRGIWRGWYKDANGNERIYATTHFQPYNARQAFPCWDEPLYKAVFKIHLSAPASYDAIFSNTALESESTNGGRVTKNFYETPKMSSYLVTFLVSESFQVIAENKSFTPPIRIIGRSNTAGLGDHALELSVKMTEFFDKYFEIPYSTLHPHLLNDHISSPDWASAGTENWGMVGYSNTWINEGFASYFGYIATHEVFPQYELHEHFNSRYLQTSLSFDSGLSTVPMNYDVNTPAQVTGHFGTVSYSKGAAFLRMLADMITPETFRKACKYFLIDNAYEATYPEDLYDAFAKAIAEDGALNAYRNFNFTSFYDIWVNKAGNPILTVTINHATGEMNLKQERFLLSTTAAVDSQVYPIPITYSSKSNPSFTNVRPSLYRVNYDEKSWNLIADALVSSPETIHHLNRAQVVDDVFALMRAERLSYEFGFKILRFLRNEVNYHVWNPAISGYTWLRNRFRHLPDVQANFDAHILSLMEHVIDVVGFEPKNNETPTVSLTRQEVLHFACLLGHEKCVQESRERFVALRNGTWIDPRIRRNVYVVGIREGSEVEFNFLLDRFVNSNFANDQLEMLRGLGATKDKQLLLRYLALTLTKSVRCHDKATSFNYALLGNKENARTVLEFVKNNIDEIRKAYIEDAPPNPVHTALSNLAAYLEEEELVEYETWLRSTQSNSAQFASAISAITSSRNNMAWGSSKADEILSAARDGATSVIVSTSLIITMAILV
ncbi:unnamed protein product [Leptidea sinapis]|uniref:Aminopeptidase N n=1 Tax=Leptidea sinapis TaxID=189913 RepID=A0A5E4QVA0_9NEOP|nr:unnamed protein product [Leptidea sinapis]